MVEMEPERDGNGDPIPGTGESFDIEGCAAWPTGTSEDNFRAATTTEDLTMLAPVYETDLSEFMTVTRRGQKYTIEGKPAAWLNLDGSYAGTQVMLKRGS